MLEAENRSVSLHSFFDRREKTAACSRLKIAQFRSKAASSIIEKKELHVPSCKIAQFRSKSSLFDYREKSCMFEAAKLSFAPKAASSILEKKQLHVRS